MGVKANKRRGHKAEAEFGERTCQWPAPFTMERTGLDGGHDLRGPQAVGESKAVKAGPEWLKGGLAQLDNTPTGEKYRFLFIKLSRGPGRPTRRLVLMDLDQWEALLPLITGRYIVEE